VNAAERKRITTLLSTWRDDPVLFAREALSADPWGWQAEALAALATNDFLSIRSAHGVGKSAFLSWATLWYLTTRFPVKILCTAPTGHQLSDVLWAEIALWMSRMNPIFRDQFTLNTEKISVKGAESNSFAVARTARKENPDAFQGMHSENLLLIADEASGIHDAIYEAGEGTISTPGAKMIMTGNPTRRTGYFFDSFHKQRDYWWRKKVSSFDMEGAPYYNPEYAGRIESRYGKDSNIYRVRVLGEFPIENDDSVIPYWHVEAATKRDVEPIENIRPVWGLDVARFGDCKTALAKRQGNVQLEPIKTWKKRDTMEVAGLIAREYEETPLDMQPSEIMVDAIGVGAGVVDRLREMGLPARGINVGEAASGRKDMGRLRDELWWRCREWFEQQDCKILDDEELIGQLTSIGYDTESSGKIKVWSKERLRKEGRESPDVADAFVLTFAGIKHRYNVESLDSYRTRMRKRAAHRGGRNWLTR
jgi:hypothetical protein